jgi:hypothetical protein
MLHCWHADHGYDGCIGTGRLMQALWARPPRLSNNLSLPAGRFNLWSPQISNEYRQGKLANVGENGIIGDKRA